MLPSAVAVCGDSDPWDFLVLKLCERCTNPRRTQVLIFLEQLLRALNVAEVFTFGSVPLRTCLPDADVDVSVFLAPSCAHPAPFFSLLHSHLNNLAMHSQFPKSTNNTNSPHNNNNNSFLATQNMHPLPPPLSLSGEIPANSIPLTSRSDSVLVMGHAQRTVGNHVNSAHTLHGFTNSNSNQNANSEFGVRDVVYVGSADVPVMKCSVHGVALDITANQLGGVCSLNLFEQIDCLVGQHHLFKRSVLLIKSFLHYETRLMGSHHRLLSSYTLNTLVLFLFNVFHTRISHPRVALILFCAVFAEFNWAEYGLTIFGRFALSRLPEIHIEQANNGDTLIKQSDLEPFTEAFATLVTATGGTVEDKVFQARTMNVVDCLQPHNNLGRSMSPANTLRFCRALKLAAATLFSIHLPHLSVTPPLALKHTTTTPPTTGARGGATTTKRVGANKEGSGAGATEYPHAENQGLLILGAFSNTLSHLGMLASPLVWPALRRVKDVGEVVHDQPQQLQQPQQQPQQHKHNRGEGWVWADWVSSSMVAAIIMAEPTSTERARGFTQKFEFAATSSPSANGGAEDVQETNSGDGSGSTRSLKEKGKLGTEEHALNEPPSPTSTITPPLLPSLPTLSLSSHQATSSNAPSSPALHPVNLRDLSRTFPEYSFAPPPHQQKQPQPPHPHVHTHHKYSPYQPAPQTSYPYGYSGYPFQPSPTANRHHVAMPGEESDSESDDDSENDSNCDSHNGSCGNKNGKGHENAPNARSDKSEQGLETSEAMVDRTGVLKGDLKGIASAMQAIHRWAKAKRDMASSLATLETCSNTSNTSATSHNTNNTGGGVAPFPTVNGPQSTASGIPPNQHHGIVGFPAGLSQQHHELNPVFGYHGLSGNVGMGMSVPLPITIPPPEYAHVIAQSNPMQGNEFPALPIVGHPGAMTHPATLAGVASRAIPPHSQPQSQQPQQPQPRPQPAQTQSSIQPETHTTGSPKSFRVSAAPKQTQARPATPTPPNGPTQTPGALTQATSLSMATATPNTAPNTSAPARGAATAPQIPATNANHSGSSTPRRKQQQPQQRPVDAWMVERRASYATVSGVAPTPPPSSATQTTPPAATVAAQVTWSNRPSSVVRPAQPVPAATVTVVKKPPVNSSNNRRPGPRRAPDSAGGTVSSPRYGKRQERGDEDWPTLSAKQGRGRGKPKF